MINNPNLLNELIKKLNEIPEKIIKESIKEVIEEDEYIRKLENITIPKEEYKTTILYNIILDDIFNFDMLHISTSTKGRNYNIQIEEAA